MLPDDNSNNWSKENFESIKDKFSKIKNLKNKTTSEEKSFKEEQPKRDVVIQEDDITNLKIALNTSNTIDELLENI